MHKSPSLFFDILAEDDESKRNEKIKRASFDIKSTLASSPGATISARASPAAATSGQHVQAQQSVQIVSFFTDAAPTAGQETSRLSTDTPVLRQPGRVTFDAATSCQSPDLAHSEGIPTTQRQPQQLQKQQNELPADPAQLVLSPQEVLQELLGDLYIDEQRLVMGELLGQGGFADVHAAQLVDPLLPDFSEPVAVKRLRPDVLKGPADLKEFLTEANLLRKLAHRNIVALRGVGACDLSDLVNMRESMFVVQEFMAGGDLKQLVLAAMGRPFNSPYSKPQAFRWAMHIAEAMHYLHSVCKPMIIHRDLKLDNVLLSSTVVEDSVAKLADFGLHKRVRRMVSSGALVAWNQETTYHGGDFERSFYGGNLYLTRRSTVSVCGSITDDISTHGSVGGSLHGPRASAVQQAAATAAPVRTGSLTQGMISNGNSVTSGPSLHSSSKGVSSESPSHSGRSSESGSCPTTTAAGVPQSDSAASFQQSSLQGSMQPGSPGFQQQQQHLMDALKAKSQGRLGKQDFVTRMLSVSARNEIFQGPGELVHRNSDVSRTIAAVVALEGSVRAGTAYYQDNQQHQQYRVDCNGSSNGRTPTNSTAPVARPGNTNSKGSSFVSKVQSKKKQLQSSPRQPSELCPQLLEELKDGLRHAKDSQAFIEATQKVGSLMYMAPEVLTGHKYNEKIDVFSFGIILYELLSGTVIAGRVAMAGQHDELMEYAREVANGHREPIPSHWPPQVRDLISSCWAQDPDDRPGFRQVLKQLYVMKQSGVDVQMDECRPKGNYNPVTDCGCSIM